MIRIAIVDDDKNFCEELSKQISRLNSSFDICHYQDIDSFAKTAGEFNIAIIDIMLQKNNGIDKASDILSEFPLLNIIFVSVERDFFQDVYRVNHSYFMVKPVSDAELRQALSLCCKNLNEQQFYIKQHNGTAIIDLNNVLYFEGMLKKTIVHYANNNEQTFNIPLRDIENRLCNTNFIRTHQSYIVNLRYVIHASKSVLNVNGTNIPVSRKYAAVTADAVDRYISGSMLYDK